MLSRRSALTLAPGLWLASLARAQTPASSYPEKTVTVLAPFAPGGTVDIVARLLSKSLFLATLQQESAHSARRSTPLSIAMIDIDHFKRVNDVHGHPSGDKALHWVATQMSALLRDGDVLARYGGEEFAALFRGARLQAATASAEKLRAAVESSALQLDDGQLLKLTVSVGVATVGKEGASAAELVAAADAELYKAKQAGRNQVCARSVP